MVLRNFVVTVASATNITQLSDCYNDLMIFFLVITAGPRSFFQVPLIDISHQIPLKNSILWLYNYLIISGFIFRGILTARIYHEFQSN